LLQLFDCIELMKNEVKKKMHVVYERCCTKVTEKCERIKKLQPRRAEFHCTQSMAADDCLPLICRYVSRFRAKRSSSQVKPVCGSPSFRVAVASIMKLRNLHGSMIHGGFR
jgi:hypothetical protein